MVSVPNPCGLLQNTKVRACPLGFVWLGVWNFAWHGIYSILRVWGNAAFISGFIDGVLPHAVLR